MSKPVIGRKEQERRAMREARYAASQEAGAPLNAADLRAATGQIPVKKPKKRKARR